MRILKDYYVCDHCKDELSMDEVKTVTVPVELVGSSQTKMAIVKLDLCEECCNELLHVIRRHFHQFWYSHNGCLVDEEEDEDE
jgi:hypothetical protein